jgi:hypothetical protein
MYCLFVLLHVLFVCKYVLYYCMYYVLLYVICTTICTMYYCHRVSTQLQLNISYHIIPYHINRHGSKWEIFSKTQ